MIDSDNHNKNTDPSPACEDINKVSFRKFC